MMLYKYFSSEGIERFLPTLLLRITPPDQFNDPFEMCPPIDVVDVDDLVSPETVKRELGKRLCEDPSLGINHFSEKWKDMFMSELLAEKDSAHTMFLYAVTPAQNREYIKKILPQMREILKFALKNAREEFPAFQSHFQDMVHRSLRKDIGALCFSRNGNHPLMWAHYANEHKGAVIKFKTDDSCFNRGNYADAVGSFVDVSYTKARPTLNSASSENALVILSLSKAIEWEYEEEMRLILPLSDADKVVDQKYHLIQVNPLSIDSIILGCRASDIFINQTIKTVRKNNQLQHVDLYKSEPCKKDYILNYVKLE